MFRQKLEQDDKASYLCLGIQEFGNTKSLFQTAEKLGCHYILEKDLTKDDFQHTFKTIDEFLNNNDHVIVTLCTDSIQSSAAPGVSAPSPFGIEPNTARTILNYIVSKENVLSLIYQR
ncbi:arginase family protein [Bacillus sp. 522_BSPC]